SAGSQPHAADPRRAVSARPAGAQRFRGGCKELLQALGHYDRRGHRRFRAAAARARLAICAARPVFLSRAVGASDRQLDPRPRARRLIWESGMEGRKAELLQRIERDREVLLDFFRGFLRCPSPNPPGDTRQAADHIERFLSRHGAEFRVIAPNETMPNIVAT